MSVTANPLAGASDLPPPESGRYFPALDGLRALAILLVIPHNVDILEGPYSMLAYPEAMIMHAGWIGVQLFFVLSGFLITGNLLDTRHSDNYYRAFFGRRMLRIFPLYYAVLILTFVVAPMVFSMPAQFQHTQHNQIWLWTFLNNWTQPFGFGVHGFSHFWSLAVEEQFYLLWPFIVRQRDPASLLRLCLWIAFASLLLRLVMVAVHLPHEQVYMFTVCRMDALALGGAVAAIIRMPSIFSKLKTTSTQIAIAAVAILGIGALATRLYGMYDASTQTIGYTLLALGFALIILLITLPTTGLVKALFSLLSSTLLRLIGRYSFGMYVFHLPIHVFFGAYLLHVVDPDGEGTGRYAFAYTVVMVSISFVLAALSYHFFERHFLRLKRRFVA